MKKSIKDQILEITGMSEEEFYNTYPRESDKSKLIAKYGKKVEKLLNGGAVKKAQTGDQFDLNGNFKVSPAPLDMETYNFDKNQRKINRDAEQVRKQNLKQGVGIIEPQKNFDLGIEKEDVQTGFQAASSIGSSIQRYAAARAAKKAAKDQNKLLTEFSPLIAQANSSMRERPERNYLRPDDPNFLIQPDTLHNPLGSGPGLYAKNGTEIANTFAPNTIYTDLEQMQDGGAAGLIPEAINTVGDMAAWFGGMNTRKLQKENEKMMSQMGMQPGIQNINSQYVSHMERGGFVNPQVATSLEGIPMKRLFAPDPTMDTLRAGGKIIKAQKGLSSIYKNQEPGYISGGDTPEDKARQAAQMEKYGASFVPKEQVDSFMENWNKHRGSVKDVYNTFSGTTPDQFKNMSMEDVWKARFDAKKLNSETYNKIKDEEQLANKQIITDQIRGMRSNYLPEEESIYNFYEAQSDSLENSYNKFNKLSNEYMLQKEKESGLSQLELDAKYKQLFKLRAGGHLKSYTPPSERSMYTGREQFAMGGDLKVHRGKAEPMSYNPYLGSETVMFKGPSHDDGGMPIEFGNNPVEVEGGEPAVKLRNGSDGSSNLTVYGNLKIPSFGASMMGDPKAKGQKFKNYVADLSKTEERQNKLIDKSTTALDELDVNNSFDTLKFNSYKSNMLGANMKLKDIADKKIKAASLQEAINNTAEEMGLSADDLAKGKVKQAKMGAKITVAKDGVITKEQREKAKQLYESGDIKGFQKYVQEIAPDIVKTIIREQGMPNAGTFVDALKGPRTEEAYKRLMNPVAYETPGSRMPERKPQIQLPSNMPGVSGERRTPDTTTGQPEGDKFDWMNIANQILPYVRPSDAESLDPRQLAGEMYALSTNQVEPVDAQLFQPQLSTPYDISLQDQLNANQSDYRAAQRMTGYNPAAQAMLNAQKYKANQQVLGEQFRMNQALKDQTYRENRSLLDQANLQNLQILDQQYGRQQQALSNTKATTQAALNSISAKYMQNQAENRQLQAYENLYNYRFDARGRAVNMNPLAQFDTNMDVPVYDEEGNLVEIKRQTRQKFDKSGMAAGRTETIETKEKKRNGALVKAIKSM